MVMQKIIFTGILFLLSIFLIAQNNRPPVYIDGNGMMRWTDTRNEASFYGVNYTLPFAHAYRAMNYLGKNHKEAIDKDVYHFARLGFNAYRIHIWDVEISDHEGNLIENDHLDLLDYLIAKLKERNISILITTMTNFGNGYPEKNQKTGGFSYLYEKCRVHSHKDAILAQERYVCRLISHINPYTNTSYKDDPAVIGFEINNEPCHSDSPRQTEGYINRMLAAFAGAGNKKPVFYNVSHNMGHVQAYYNTAIQGTTYQWYPTGLVAGHTRKGNFLPYVDNFHIPFSDVKGFDKKAKIVYEFDPADITCSYMYPAMARTFRSNGFQWITQFAYDPMDMAWANTEYQTHFLNLAYTPNKAISMKIAAQVAYTVPANKSYGKYPSDTIFDHFRVSYLQDLSLLNSGEEFFYSNNTTSAPVDPGRLKSIAGCGNSPLVAYQGTGAYFIDKLDEGLWRLEVMPDAVQVKDPFQKPSLNKEVVTIAWNRWNMDIRLHALGENFRVAAIDKGNIFNKKATGTTIAISPGVYLLSRGGYTPGSIWNTDTQWNNIRLGEYAAPRAHTQSFSVVHNAHKVIENNKPVQITAEIAGQVFPDSVLIYTDKISFWSQNNPYVKMRRMQGYTYRAEVPPELISSGTFRYNIVVCSGKKNYTFPAGAEGHPLDWDFYKNKYWQSKVVEADSPVELVRISDQNSEIETYAIPEASGMVRNLKTNPVGSSSLEFRFRVNDPQARFFWRKYIRGDIATRMERLQQAGRLCIDIRNASGIDKLNVGFITIGGFTYSSVVDIDRNGICYVRLSGLQQGSTTLLPSPYPLFLDRVFTPDVNVPFNIEDIESLEFSTTGDSMQDSTLEVGNIWME